MVVAGQLPTNHASKIEYEIVANQAGGTYTVAGSYNTTDMVSTYLYQLYKQYYDELFKIKY